MLLGKPGASRCVEWEGDGGEGGAKMDLCIFARL